MSSRFSAVLPVFIRRISRRSSTNHVVSSLCCLHSLSLSYPPLSDVCPVVHSRRLARRLLPDILAVVMSSPFPAASSLFTSFLPMFVITTAYRYRLLSCRCVFGLRIPRSCLHFVANLGFIPAFIVIPPLLASFYRRCSSLHFRLFVRILSHSLSAYLLRSLPSDGFRIRYRVPSTPHAPSFHRRCYFGL
jgi:hypothetical protein